MLTGTNLKFANSYNVRIILEIIRLHGPVSRIDISRSTRLTAQTVTNITKKLIRAGLIYESDRQQSGRGAPSIMLEVKPTAAYSIGVDFDKDHLTCVLVDLNGEICERLSMDLTPPKPEEAMDLITRSVQELISGSGIKKNKIWGVGVGFPGPMIVMEGSVRSNAVNPQFFPGWDHVPVVKILEKKLDLPVFLENNASAAAIGERWYGAGKYVDTFFYIFLGAGLGGGVILNGQLFSGFRGNAGELGYLPILNGKEAMPDQASGRIPHLGMCFSLLELYRDLEKKGHRIESPSDLDSLFNEKEETLMKWIEKGAGQLVFSVLAIEYLLDPEMIFFGGRLPSSIIGEIIHRLETILPEHRFPDLKDTPELKMGAAGEDAAALGSATLPLYASFAPLPSLLWKRSDREEQKIGERKRGM